MVLEDRRVTITKIKIKILPAISTKESSQFLITNVHCSWNQSILSVD
jgi:hypothetical protein